MKEIKMETHWSASLRKITSKMQNTNTVQLLTKVWRTIDKSSSKTPEEGLYEEVNLYTENVNREKGDDSSTNSNAQIQDEITLLNDFLKTNTPVKRKPISKELFSTPMSARKILNHGELVKLNNEENHYEEIEFVKNNNNFIRSTLRKTMPGKFMVNLYESRAKNKVEAKELQSPKPSKEALDNSGLKTIYKKLYIKQDLFSSKPNKLDKVCSEATSSNDSLYKYVSISDDVKMTEFLKLKDQRDVICARMNEASNALKTILEKRHIHRPANGELIAEKILLETGEQYRLIVNRIREVEYTEIKTRSSKHLATVVLSNLHFPLKPQDKSHKGTEYFLCMATCGTVVKTTNPVAPINDSVSFDDVLEFKNLESNFVINLNIYSIKYEQSILYSASTLLRKSKQSLPFFTIQYKNFNTNELEETDVLKSSLKQCGEFQIRKENLQQGNTWKIQTTHALLKDTANLKVVAKNLSINDRISGFLNLGSTTGQCLTWNLKWCVLDGTNFKIYNCPFDEDFVQPLISINLNYSCKSKINLVDRSICPKARTFALEIGRPSTCDDIINNTVTIRSRPNFVVDYYYFNAETNKEFTLWMEHINCVLRSLSNWKALIFVE